MYQLMAETFMINQLAIKSKSMMKLERLQQEREASIRQVLKEVLIVFLEEYVIKMAILKIILIMIKVKQAQKS